MKLIEEPPAPPALPGDFRSLGISVAVSLATRVFGLFDFRRVEIRFADIA